MQGFSADTVTKNRHKIIVSLKIRLITHIILRSIKYYIVKFTPSYQIRFSLMMSKHTDTNQITRYSTNFGGLISCTAFSPKPHLVLCQILPNIFKKNTKTAIGYFSVQPNQRHGITYVSRKR